MRVSKWIIKHRPSLGDAMVCSFNIPKNPRMQRKQVLEVSAKFLPEQSDERCLVIFDIKRGDLAQLVKEGGQFAAAAEARKSYEVQSIAADPDFYGTGLVFLFVWYNKELLFMRGLPISFDHEMANKVVPERDAVWQDELLKKTGCIPMIRAGLAHMCCDHCDHH